MAALVSLALQRCIGLLRGGRVCECYGTAVVVPGAQSVTYWLDESKLLTWMHGLPSYEHFSLACGLLKQFQPMEFHTPHFSQTV